MKKILLMFCSLFACTLNAQTEINEPFHGLSVDVSVNTDTQDISIISGSDASSLNPAGCSAPPNYNDFGGSKRYQSTYVYYGAVTPYVSEIDQYEWYTEPGTGWTITDRNLGAPMQYVQITGSSASTETILLVRAHNSCGWSSYQVVSSIPVAISDATSLNPATEIPVREDPLHDSCPEYVEDNCATSEPSASFVSADCDVPSLSNFSAWETSVSSTVYYGNATSSGGAIDKYEWWVESGWTVTDRQMGLPMQYVQITAPSSTASTVLLVRAHNSCGWSAYKVVNGIGP